MATPKFKILSIDGGGIRGIIPCVILRAIQAQLQNAPLANYFDLFAGTSTGGIITLGLTTKKPNDTKPYTAMDLLALYVNEGPTIFNGRKNGNFLLNIVNDGLGDRPYDEKEIERILLEKFYHAELADVVKDVIITSYDINAGMPFYFQSRLAREEKEMNKIPAIENQLVRAVARSTSAAPTFFNPSVVQIDNKDAVLVDGGVFANNPALIAFGEAKELWRIKNQKGKAYSAVVSKDDDDVPFFMLSIGTGNTTKPITEDDVRDATAKTWIKPLIKSVLMDGVAASTHYSMQYILPKYQNDEPRYIRLNVDLDRYKSEYANIGAMDDASQEHIAILQKAANDFVNENKPLLKSLVKLIDNKVLNENDLKNLA